MAKTYRDYALTIVLVILAALSTYYTTIGSIKIELAGKAEETLVANLDKRLFNLESRLAENFATKKDFYQLKEDLLLRLTRIESRLDTQAGHLQSSSFADFPATAKQSDRTNPKIARLDGQGVNR
jgi:hypothetical protein